MAVGITLLSNASATGNWVAWPGGRGEFRVEATFGGGIFELGAGEIRANVATATAVYAVALRIPSPTY